MSRSATDIHWNERVVQELDATAVNIADTSQRQLETEFLLKHLDPADRVLEVGCGNGFLTNIIRDRVAHVDAFDYADNMVRYALKLHGVRNNRFFHDNVLAPSDWQGPYDSIVCVRVLINLRDFSEQNGAVDNMRNALRPGGRLVLIEGFSDGFKELNLLRAAAGIEGLQPAKINYYSALSDMREYLNQGFSTTAEFHTGCFDFLTRVVYPSLVGAQNATGHSEFHERILGVARSFNPEAFASMARLRGFVLVKR